MRYLLITILLLLTGCGNQGLGSSKEIDEHLKLKAPKEKILEVNEVKDIRCNNNNCKNYGLIKKYDYISDIKVKNDDEEIVEKRLKNVKFFKNNKINIYIGSPFYKQNNEWFYVETGTTTLEIWEKETSNNFIKKIIGFFVKNTKADTFYVGAGDGYVAYSGNNWSTVRGASTGDEASHTASYIKIDRRFISPNFYLSRAFFPADTSSIPDTDTITSAILHIKSDGGCGNTGETVTLVAVTTSQSSPTSLSTADFNQIGSINLGTDTVVNDATPEWVDIIISNPDSNINKTGYTKLGIREKDFDFDNVQPSANAGFVCFYPSEETGTDNDPYYEITYSPSAAEVIDEEYQWR